MLRLPFSYVMRVKVILIQLLEHHNNQQYSPQWTQNTVSNSGLQFNAHETMFKVLEIVFFFKIDNNQ